MDLDKVTLQDCIDMAELKGKFAVINDGRIIGFTKERW